MNLVWKTSREKKQESRVLKRLVHTEEMLDDSEAYINELEDDLEEVARCLEEYCLVGTCSKSLSSDPDPLCDCLYCRSHRVLFGDKEDECDYMD